MKLVVQQKSTSTNQCCHFTITLQNETLSD